MGRFDLGPGPTLLVAVRGAWADHQMAAGGGVVPQPGQQGVVGDQQARHDQHRQLGGQRGGLESRLPSGADELVVVEQPGRHPGLEGAAVEGLEDPVVGPLVDVGERRDGGPPGFGKAAWNASPHLDRAE